jgi:hypothetical protein
MYSRSVAGGAAALEVAQLALAKDRAPLDGLAAELERAKAARVEAETLAAGPAAAVKALELDTAGAGSLAKGMSPKSALNGTWPAASAAFVSRTPDILGALIIHVAERIY